MASTDIFSDSLKNLLRNIGPDNTPCATNPEFWVGAYPSPATNQIAKTLCGTCPVRVQCLETALIDNEPFGVWGGLTPDERKILKRRKR